MDFEKQPKFAKVKDEDDNISWLWLRRDGRAFVGDANLDYYESASPTNIGIVHACNYWMGAVHACGDPVRALQLTLQHCEYVGGEPQVEYL